MDITTLREIGPEEFAGSNFFHYEPEVGYTLVTPGYTEGFDKIRWIGEPFTTQVELRTFEFWDGTGVAMASTYERREDGGYHYVLRLFAFGCQHKYNELTIAQCRERSLYHAGRCYHVYECSECGHIMSQDSSD